MSTDYLQKALRTFNTDKPNWYGWKTHEDNGDKIPNTDRMQHKYIKVIKEGATIPSKSDLDAKIAELKTAQEDVEAAHITKKASGKTKLKNLGLTDDEIKALTGA